MKKRLFIIIAILTVGIFWVWVGFQSKAGVEQLNKNAVEEVLSENPLTVEIKGSGKVEENKREIIYTKLDGFVKQIYVKEKQYVAARTSVLLLENRARQEQLSTLEYQRDLKAKELERLNEQVKKYAIERERISLELQDLQRQLAQLQKKYELTELMQKSGGLAEKSRDEVKEEMEANHSASKKAGLSLANLNVDETVQQNLIAAARLDLANLAKQCEDLRRELQNMQVGSEKAGILSQLSVEEGQWVSAGTQVGILADPDEKLAEIWVNEFDISYVKRGQEVVLQPDYDQTLEIIGRVTDIDENPQLKNGLTLFKVQVTFTNRYNFFSGLTIHAVIRHQVRERTLTLPIDALMEERNDEKIERYVFIREGDKIQRRVVKTGIIQGGRIEIIAGLASGENVITGPYEYLQSLKRAGGK